MSHFTVAVITHEGQDVDELLAPYQENNMGDCPAEYMEFCDITDEIENSWKNDTTTAVVFPDGTVERPHSDKFCVPITEEEYKNLYDEDRDSVTYRYDGTKKVFYRYDYGEGEKRTVPISRLYKDIDDYADRAYGCQRNDEGRFGYYENPNAKWDWYQIGGRWAGMLRAKSGEHGTPSWCNKGYEETDGYFDSAKIKDIDFSPDEKSYKSALRFWEVVVEGSELREDEKPNDFFHLYNKQYYIDRYLTKENFAKDSSTFSTFAVITPDGEWHEKGAMGWFGCSSESHEEARKWSNTWYDAFIKDRDGEDYLTVVDCHI